VLRARVRLRRGPLDRARGDRGGRASAYPDRRAVRAVLLAGCRPVRQPRDVGDAGGVRRACGEDGDAAGSSALAMSGRRNSHSDALVFFGATGDLAYKQIFPALQSLIRHGKLDVPVVGVAKSGWGIEQLRERARRSLEEHGGVDEDAFAKLVAQLRYIDGDYGDPATFDQLRRALGDAQHPLHYLAIPPSLFDDVVEQLGRSGCAPAGARVVVEKPFGRDLRS